jgi:hypothetical protein
MDPIALLNTVYLGDRGCKAMIIDGWRNRVAIQIDLISRLEPGTKEWNFYSKQDIADGALVFTDVTSLTFEPPGPLPNDFILDYSARTLGENILFEFSIASGDLSGESQTVCVRILARGLHLEDPARPGVQITS